MTAARHGAGCVCTGCDDLRAMTAAPTPTVDVPVPAPAHQAQDGRTTAEWIADLVKARQAAEAAAEAALESEAELHRRNYILATTSANLYSALRNSGVIEDELTAERDALTAKLARVEALADAMAINDCTCECCREDLDLIALRAALADPEPAQVQQAVSEDTCCGEYDTDARPACGSSCVADGAS